MTSDWASVRLGHVALESTLDTTVLLVAGSRVFIESLQSSILKATRVEQVYLMWSYDTRLTSSTAIGKLDNRHILLIRYQSPLSTRQHSSNRLSRSQYEFVLTRSPYIPPDKVAPSCFRQITTVFIAPGIAVLRYVLYNCSLTPDKQLQPRWRSLLSLHCATHHVSLWDWLMAYIGSRWLLILILSYHLPSCELLSHFVSPVSLAMSNKDIVQPPGSGAVEDTISPAQPASPTTAGEWNSAKSRNRPDCVWKLPGDRIDRCRASTRCDRLLDDRRWGSPTLSRSATQRHNKLPRKEFDRIIGRISTKASTQYCAKSWKCDIGLCDRFTANILPHFCSAVVQERRCCSGRG